jgi:hypothetical protein
MGRNVLGPAVQHGVYFGSFSSHEEFADIAALRAHSRRMHAVVRPRCPVLRSGAAVGADPVARLVCECAGLEGEQLQPIGDRSAESPRTARQAQLVLAAFRCPSARPSALRSAARITRRTLPRCRISFDKTVTYDLEIVPQFRDLLIDKALISLVLAMAQWHLALAVAQLNNLS